MSGTGAKPKKKRNSFSAALDAAAKRYGKAVKEREAAVRKLDELNQEIPALAETMRVLQKQLGRVVMPIAEANTASTPVVVTGGQPSGERAGAVPPLDMKNIPDEIAKHLVLDLSSAGSIPAPQPEEKSANAPASDK